MTLKLMYITNEPEVAQIAEKACVDRIFVDLEYIGKNDRQSGMDSVKSDHTMEDVKKIRKTIKKAEMLVRCNPIHEATENYGSSEEEINEIVENGADIIMLPYFKTVQEAERFLKCVDKRTKTLLLVETPEAVEILDELLKLENVDEIFIGLNDLSLGYGKDFMFELLADGTVEKICKKCKETNTPYGFGGIASLGKGKLESENVIAEHYRLGSKNVILSRSFCDIKQMGNLKEVDEVFTRGVTEIREYEEYCKSQELSFFNKNKEVVKRKVEAICGELR